MKGRLHLYMTKKMALIFPGQGSQYEGLGRDIIDSKLEISKVYQNLYSIVGEKTAQKILNAKKEDLSMTRYAQLAIFLDSVLLCKEFKNRYSKYIEVVSSTGLSLGEYSALCSSGAFDIETGIKIINKRGEIMEKAASGKGGMIAVIKPDIEEISNIILEIKKEKNGVIDICNLNSPAQIVVGGEYELIDIFKEKCLKNKIKSIIDLDVEGPFHTEILKEASIEFGEILDKIEYKMPRQKVYSNFDAREYTKKEEFSKKLQKQMYSPVYFEKIIRNMLEEGIKDFIEIGPGKTLRSFVRKIDKKVNVSNIENIQDLESYKV